MTDLRAKLAAAVGCVLTLACAPRSPKTGYPHGVALEARLVAAGWLCDGKDDGLAAIVGPETRALREVFLRQGIQAQTPLPNPTSSQLLRDVGRPSSGPVLWFYSGHSGWIDAATGRLLSMEEHRHPLAAPVKSALCLADGPLALDKVVASFSADLPFALLIVNSCFAGHIDVRRSPVDVAVLSASTGRIDIRDNSGTALGRALLQGPIGALDLDCDGWVSDLDLFGYVSDEVTKAGVGAPVPKLRRQVRSTPHLLRSRSCRTGSPIAYFPPPGAYEWRWDERARRLTVLGYLSWQTTITIGGSVLAGEDLVAVPCREDVGQCFVPLASLSMKGGQP
jgi:hypothetical protein